MEKPKIQYHVPQLPVEVDILDDWDTFLMTSQLNGGIDANATMDHVKRFFMSFDFQTPINLVSISEPVLNRILESGTGYSPPGGLA